MAKVREMAMPLPLAMPLAMPLAREMPLAMPLAREMPLAMPCELFLNCRHLYYTWILKFYMETFWTALNSEPSPNTFTPYPCRYILLQLPPLSTGIQSPTIAPC